MIQQRTRWLRGLPISFGRRNLVRLDGSTMGSATVLAIDELTVPNRANLVDNRLVPRPLSIDGFRLAVAAHQRVLLVAGWGAGKSTLMDTIRSGHPSISVALDWHVIAVDGDGFPASSDPKAIYLKDRFDPTRHRQLMDVCKINCCTLVAASEVDKLPTTKRDDFTRIVVLDDGRVVADQAQGDFESKLVLWIDKYARDRSRHLRKDSRFLRKYFDLQLESAWPDCS